MVTTTATSSQAGSSPCPKINTHSQTPKCNKNITRMSLKEPETNWSRPKRRKEETTSQGSSTRPQIHTRSTKILKSTPHPENKEKILLQDSKACRPCGKCSCVPPPKFTRSDGRSGDISCLSTPSFVSGDQFTPTKSNSSGSSIETTAVSKPNDVMLMELLSCLYDDGKLNDEDVSKALKLFKDNTTLRNMFFRLREEMQVKWIKDT